MCGCVEGALGWIGLGACTSLTSRGDAGLPVNKPSSSDAQIEPSSHGCEASCHRPIPSLAKNPRALKPKKPPLPSDRSEGSG